MSETPKEAFPWHPDEQFDDSIVDNNGDYVATLHGWGGNSRMTSAGVAERRRMIVEVPAMLKFLRELASELPGYRDWKGDRAAEILDRIEGKDAP